eukprot:jgi/Chrzof1/12417/Cz06g33210.t1
MKPVFECLPAFFPPEVPFVMIEYRNLSLMSLMSYGLHALPVLQVTAKGKKFRYSGKHHLGTMVQFVARALGTEPLASVESSRLCSSDNGSSCNGWYCPRWNGEATVEELAAQQHAPMFYISIVFLVCRACFWIWRKRRRQPQQQPEQHQQAEATATGDQAEGPATQADHGSSNGTLAGVDTAGAVAGTAGAVAGSAGTAAAADEVT